jgi:hypothetical protein
LEIQIPNPKDEAGFTMSELLDRIKNTNFPLKFVLFKPLSNEYFKEYFI